MPANFRDNPFWQPLADRPLVTIGAGEAQSVGARYFTRPEFRVSLTHLDSGDSLEAQFNPTELNEALEVVWNNAQIPGMSHQPQQYGGTGNLGFEMELYFNAYSTPESLARLDAARRLLHSWCYPKVATTVAETTPPRLLFVWPGLVSLTCILKKVAIKHSRFNRYGQSVQYVAALTLEEIRDTRLLADDVKLLGTQRGGSASDYPENLPP